MLYITLEMSALEFCEECEVYHHTTLIDGQLAFTQCQKTIPHQFTNRCSSPSHNTIALKQHDLSPISRSSFTSINHHLSPQRPQKSQFQLPKGSTIVLNRNSSPQPQGSLNLNYKVNQNKAPPPVQISFQTVRRAEQPKPLPQSRILHAKPLSRNYSLNIGKKLLSTIVQQKNDETERSIYTSQQASCRNSKRASMEEWLPTEADNMTLAQKFAQARRTQDQVIGPVSKSLYVFKKIKKYNVDSSHLQQQKNCWCW